MGERALLVVDSANVVGSVPDGWWKDRVGATERLRDALAAVADAGLPGVPGPIDVVLVVEGDARGVLGKAPVEAVAAAGSGDDAVVAIVRERGAGRRCFVATADRELSAAVQALGASLIGPRTLRDLATNGAAEDRTEAVAEEAVPDDPEATRRTVAGTIAAAGGAVRARAGVSLFDTLKRAFDGGRDEMSRDNLVRLVVDRIVALREYGRKGEHALPPEVGIEVAAPAERLEVLRKFVEDPGFDRDVEDELLNRLVGVSRDELPLRLYAVEAVEDGQPAAITATGRKGVLAVRLTIAGGDRDGAVMVAVPGQKILRLGRGQWHGPDQQERNDLMVSNADPFVSRRAARLRRLGAAWEVEALDQGECLVVLREDGTRVRPHHTPTRWVTVRSGDTLEFNDGAQRIVRVGLEVVLDRSGP